jgi:hypothetical protein
MDPIENYISDALEIVSSWDLEDETSFARAVNMQARLMAGVPSADYWSDDSDTSIQ